MQHEKVTGLRRASDSAHPQVREAADAYQPAEGEPKSAILGSTAAKAALDRRRAAYREYEAARDTRDEVLLDIPATGPEDRAEVQRELEEERADFRAFQAEPDAEPAELEGVLTAAELAEIDRELTARYERRIAALQARLEAQ